MLQMYPSAGRKAYVYVSEEEKKKSIKGGFTLSL